MTKPKVPTTIAELRKALPKYRFAIDESTSRVHVRLLIVHKGVRQIYRLAEFYWPWYGDGIRKERRAIIAAIYVAARVFEEARERGR